MREIGQPENVVQTALVKSTVGLIEAGGHRFPANMRFFFLGRDGRATEVRWWRAFSRSGGYCRLERGSKIQNTNTEPIEREGAATVEKIRSTLALIIRMAGELEDPVSRLLDHAATPWEDERAACLCRTHDHLHRAFFPLGQSGSLLHNELDWWAMEPGDELKGNAPYEILPTAEDPATRWRVATPAEVIATPAAPNSRSSSNCVNSPPRSVR